MHALIVVTHPDPGSLTHALAREVASGVACAGHGHELADLAAEGFDPRFSRNDLAVHLQTETPSEAVLAEQARIDRADALVLVHPVYWWSFPALLKGWIDRVFANGWAYGYTPETGVEKKLGRLGVHLLGVGGAGSGTWARHGYRDAMRTQVDHGILDYCGARVVTSELLLDGEPQGWQPALATARRIGCSVFPPVAEASFAA